MHAILATRRVTRSPIAAALLLLSMLLALGQPLTARAAGASMILKLSTAFPIVDSGAWSVVNLSFSCSAVVSVPCENVAVTTVLPPELAGGLGDVQAYGAGTIASYNPATRTVSWAFTSQIAPGDAGMLELRVRFPAGPTGDGASATLRAEMRSTSAPPKLSNPLTLTARARPLATLDKTMLSGGAADIPTVYSLKVCIPEKTSAVVNLDDVLITDTLPLGASFISATHGGTLAGGAVTWPATSLSMPDSRCAERRVVVSFPGASFSVGDQLRNDAEVSARAGSATLLLSDSDVRLLQPPTPGSGFHKEGSADALVGDLVSYTLSLTNTGTTALSDAVITDTIPPELEVTRLAVGGHELTATVRIALEYATSLDPSFAPAPGGPFSGPACVSVAPAGGCPTSVALDPGERITAVRWRYLDPLPFGYVVTAHGLTARVLDAPVNTIIVNRAASSTSFNGVRAVRTGEARTRVLEPGAYAVVGKAATPEVIYAGDVVQYTVGLTNTTLGGVGAAMLSPALGDLLVGSLSYEPGSSAVITAPVGAPDPSLEILPNYNATGRTLLRWRWDGYSLPAGESLHLRFAARVKPSTLSGRLTNSAALVSVANAPGEIALSRCSAQEADAFDLDGDGNTSELICSSSISSVSLARAANTSSAKLVLGQLDSAWTRDPLTGKTAPGGMADYRLAITNTNTVPLSRLVLIDILPWEGDVGVQRFTEPRGSQWRPFLVGPINAPPGAVVYYSTVSNPCRNPELGLTTEDGLPIEAPGCVDPAWSTAPPADITAVRAVKVDFGSLVLQPQDSVLLTWPMRAPVGGVPGEIAWNTFAYTASDLSGNALPVSEPPRVGIERGAVEPPAYGNYVWHDADLDGVQDAGEPGVNGARIELYEDSDASGDRSPGDRLIGFTVAGPDDDGNPGYYLFSESFDQADPRYPGFLAPGDYYTVVTAPPGHGLTVADAGDDAADSDVDPATGVTPVTNLASGEIDLSWDVGLVTDTAVGNYVWLDRNANGLQDEPASEGLNGIAVTLHRPGADGLPGTADDQRVADALTGDDPFGRPGYYLFPGLSAGDYFVAFELPAGFAFTTADGAGDTLDSDAGPGGRTAVFTLGDKQLDATRDAGLTLGAGGLTLGDRVWDDLDNDGRYEPAAGETGIDGVQLALYRDFDGDEQPDPGEYVAGTETRTVFGAPGYYQFAGLAAGDYLVAIDPDAFLPGGPLSGMRSSSGNDPAPDADAEQRDHDDNGALLGGLVRTLPITLAAGGEPDVAIDGDGKSGNQTLDLGLIRGAALGDRVWFDSDGDGLQGAGEPGVPGILVELLDGAGVELAETTTDGAGRYGFTGLAAGDYRVRFAGLPPGHTLTVAGAGAALDSDADPLTGLTPPISLAADESDLSWDAGLVAAPASIGDLVWDDQDRDGLQGVGEPGLPGVTATLFRPGPDGAAGTPDDEQVASAVTDGDGAYGFDGLPPGAYFVAFTGIPAGYAVSGMDQGPDDRDSDADRTTARTAITSLGAGEDDPTWDLGLYTFASIGDRVWLDRDADGVQDDGEPGVEGVTIRLFRPGDSAVVARTKTDGGGGYSFTGLVPGAYYLEFSLPDGYMAAAPGQGDDELDSDADPTTYQTSPTTLSLGEDDRSWDFGIFPSASVGDRVWLDRDADGVQDGDETAGVPGVQVVLLDALGGQLDTTVSDARGFYRFHGLVPGSYALQFILPLSYLRSPEDQGGADAADSDVPDSLQTDAIELVAGEVDYTWDLGLFQPSQLGDRVWHDADGDGLQDGDEAGVAGVQATLYRPGADGQPGGGDDSEAGSTTTDAGGRYSFGDLAPGRYFVQFGAAAGYSMLSPRDSAAATDETDSDVDGSRRTPVVDLGSSSVDLSLDMGVLEPASLGDYVWLDDDVDGLQDPGEAGIEGVTATLYTGAGSAVATDTTDVDGLYLFTGLAPGEYYVVFSDLPAERSFTRRDQGADDADDSDAVQGVRFTYDASWQIVASEIVGTTGIARLGSGVNDTRWDAGLYETLSLGDMVWVDADADGVQDGDELAGVPGVRVELLRDADLAVLDYTYTESDGTYLFTDLLPGTYRIRFGAIPAGYVRSPQGRGGNPAQDSDAGADLTTGPITPVSGSDLRYDLGLYLPASMGDRVWEDRDGDGVQDAGEPGVGGATVALSGTDALGATVSLTTTTGVTGAYSFAGLMPGDYAVAVTPPDGYRISAANLGGDDTLDSDADPATGAMAGTTLTSGESDTSWDAGLYRPASIGNLVWRDADGDGLQGAGEPGLGGVSVSLGGVDGAGNTVSDSTTTDGDGLYGFGDLAPGVYTVTVSAPAGELFTHRDITSAEVTGATDGSDSDADPATGAMAAATLRSGDDDTSWDAGLVVPASLGDLVWEDLDGDGVQELPAEPGLGGVDVRLTGAGRDRSFGTPDDTSATTATDGAGLYSFDGLKPGLYRVTFERPDGYAFTRRDDLAAGDAADSDVAPGIAPERATGPIDLRSGDDDPEWDAGLYQLLTLGSRVWEDRNNDGADNNGEGGLDGLTVRLSYDLNGDGDMDDAGETSFRTTTTSGGGYYLFTGLEQGLYRVEVTPGAGYISSSGANGSAGGPFEPAPDPDDDEDNGDDNGTAAGAVVRSAALTLAPGGEPEGEGDGLPAALVDPARDENSNLSVDFGLYRPASVGNLVWLDRDADGVQDGNDETGVGAVSVELYADDDGVAGASAGDTRVVTATTTVTGSYGFGNLRPGDYYLSFGLPAGYVRSPLDKTGDGVDSDADPATGRTAPIALDPGESDQTRDAGLYQRVNLGDRVWDDANNNGLYESATEVGLDNVTVNLYRDGNGDDDVLDGAETTPISTTTTAGGGLYSFGELDPGHYLVELPASNFSGVGPLAATATLPAYRSSTGAVGSPTGAYEPAPDPDTNAANNDDNGSADVSGNVRSRMITLRTQNEPTNDGDGSNGNLTLDFGLFRPLALGNLVWNDQNNDRLYDGLAESGIVSVTVQLFRDVNRDGALSGAEATAISTTTTAAGGLYRFDNLVAGDYIVRVPSSNFGAGGALRFFRSSDADDADTAPDPDTDVDGDDNGDGPGGAAPTADVGSALVTLSVDGEPTSDGDASRATNLSVDFGFYSLTVGNRVWDDLDNNGALDGAETGRDGVTVRLLYDADASGTIDAGETAGVTKITTGGGRYLFGALRHGGSYALEIELPAGFVSSTGANGLAGGPYEPAPDPDSPAGVDGDDNGTYAGGALVRTALFSMSAGAEPTGEADAGAGVANPAADGSSDLSVDFGIFDEAGLGDRVWLDADGDGLQGAGEAGVPGVTVTIYDASTGDPLDADPVAPGLQPLTATTSVTGTYSFTRLIAGDYRLVFGGIPAEYAVSPQDRGADDKLDSDASPPSMRTATIALGTSFDDSWDLGLYPRLSLGDLVWYDADDDGLKDADESGIPGVALELYRDLDGDGDAEGPGETTPVADTLTYADGRYSFAGLEQGDYIVVIPASEFAAGEPLYLHRSSTGSNGAAGGAYEPAPDPDTGLNGLAGDADDNADDDDNGSGAPGALVRSLAITLSPSAEPAADGDDANGNQTVDFGFFEPISLGNLVWEDANNNGLLDSPAERGIGGVLVQLFLDGDGDAVAQPGELVTQHTTDGGGLYSFSDLIEGSYIVRIPAGQFAAGQPLAGFVSSTGVNGAATGPHEGPATPDPDTSSVDGDDNGSTAGGNVDSPPFALSRGGEPPADDDGDGGNGNQTVDFGLFRPASIGDRVWEDANANGVQDAGEPGLGAVGVQLSGVDSLGVALTLSMTTDDDGAYGFGGLAPGVYTVTVTAPDGYTFTARGRGGDAALDSDADPATGMMAGTALASGERDTSWDAGLYVPASIGDRVWRDLDGDGLQGSGEPGVGGVTVTLSGVDGLGAAVSASASTGADGGYSFGGLLPGVYTVTVSAPAGELFTKRDITSAEVTGASDANDSDADPGTGVMSATTLTSGESDPSWDAGLYRPASIGDRVWHDRNADGRQDDGEPGLPGVGLGLSGTDGAGNPVSLSTTTDGDGRYSFGDLTPGSYAVTLTPPAGYRITAQDQSGDASDSDADPDTGAMSATLLTSGEGDTSWDAGLFQPVSLGDLVFEDFDDDGLFGAGDEPLEGAQVGLYGADGVTPAVDVGGAAVLTQTTGADGLYRFDNLRPGSYAVRALAPGGHASSTDIESTANADGDRDGDDNGQGEGASVASAAVTLSSGGEPDDDGDASSNLSVDFGFFRPARIGDLVWLDEDRDGAQDAGEPGVPGVTVELRRDGDAAALRSTTTGPEGAYRFDRLPRGDYLVRFALPADFERSPAGPGDPAASDPGDSDADPLTGETARINLEPGEEDLSWDAGLFYAAGLGNRVWLDRNADGVQDAGERGVEGVRVTLLTGSESYVDEATTDADGNYGFHHLPPGDYVLSFELPAGYSFSPQGRGGSPDADSDVDQLTGTTGRITLADGAYDPSWDAGLFQLLSLGDLVWEDLDNSGTLDGDERGIAGVPVRLFADADGDGNPDRAEPEATATTDAEGRYRFVEILPGRYVVEIAPPAWYRSSTGVPGSPAGPYEPAPPPDGDRDGDDSGNMAGERVRSGAVTLWSQDEPDKGADGDDWNGNMSVDFGLFRPASLGSTVWYDRDGDGRQGGDEAGVAGVIVTLYRGDGAPLHDGAGRPLTAVTDGAGKYLFTNLTPGDYLVGFGGLPGGYTFTSPGVGDDAGDSDADPTTGLTLAVTLGAGDQDLSLWAGLINPTAVSLVSFAAERTAEGVALRWQTGAEWDAWGFHILRSADGARAGAVRVTPRLVLARGGPQLGAEYAWVDAAAAPGASYSYWLEEHELSGATNEYGPVTPRGGASAGISRVFLPIVVR